MIGFNVFYYDFSLGKTSWFLKFSFIFIFNIIFNDILNKVLVISKVFYDLEIGYEEEDDIKEKVKFILFKCFNTY